MTFPTTGDAPVKGEYALARFTSGGDLLAGWTVTLNGQAVDSVVFSGMKVEVRKGISFAVTVDVMVTGVSSEKNTVTQIQGYAVKVNLKNPVRKEHTRSVTVKCYTIL